VDTLLRRFSFALFGLSFPLVTLANPCPLPGPADEIVKVQHVSDGDTIKLVDGRKIRFTAINTPELARGNTPAQPLAEKAKQHLQQLIGSNKIVHLKYDYERKDHHKRHLAHLFLPDGTNIQAALIEQGLAAHSLEPPNLWATDCYAKLADEAKAANRGIWAHKRFQVHTLDELKGIKGGYYRINARVTKHDLTKKAEWLLLNDTVSIRIDKKHLHYFEDRKPKTYRGLRIEAEGWLSGRGKFQYLNIKHPAALRIIE
jgi:endonuclease YncB( thermonuclease family)